MTTKLKVVEKGNLFTEQHQQINSKEIIHLETHNIAVTILIIELRKNHQQKFYIVLVIFVLVKN